MDDWASLVDAVGTTGLVALGVLLAAQVALMIAALVSVARTPAERLRGPKVLWVIVIVFGELVGPIVYFAIARKPATVDVAPVYAAPGGEPVRNAADVLYGERADKPADAPGDKPAESPPA